jgi:hypothetical protein
MSGYADSIRPQIRHTDTVVLGTGAHPSFCKGCAAARSLDALVAENQQLRLERDDLEQRLHAYQSGEREPRSFDEAVTGTKPRGRNGD